MSTHHKTAIHLLSGGLDSVVMLHDLIRQELEVHCLLVDYGQRHKQELEFAKWHCRELDVLFTTVQAGPLRGSSLVGDSGTVVVPVRNTILLSLAVNLAEEAKSECVTIGCNHGDAVMFPDCRPAFIKSFNALLKHQGSSVEVCAPYIQKTKQQIAEIGRGLSVDFWKTWSCYKGGIKACGECHACIAREKAIA